MADPKTQDPAQDADSESEGRYRHTREAFHELPLEQQARFLIEATASTMARGLEVVARSVADDMEEAFRSAEPTEEEAAEDEEPAHASATSPDSGVTEESDTTAEEASDPGDAPEAPDDPATT
jgi:hypothetical protein